ncbi:hypothetical protein TNCV_543591 [Trichonephila clavipes]|nr:hypothetical protein TNCV_543591 [Trichonephila clavipes]
MCNVLYNKQIDLVENTVEVEDKSHEEEDNGESEELVEDLDKALDLEFESGVGTDALINAIPEFRRKYDAAAVTGDILRLPGKNCLVRQAQMIGTRRFCEEEESISNSSHSEEESIETLKEKPLTLDEKN